MTGPSNGITVQLRDGRAFGRRLTVSRRRINRIARAGVITTLLGLGVLAPISAASAARPARPVLQSAPVIAGAAAVGSTLSASTGSWTNFPSTYAYAWQRCDDLGATCVPIASTNAATYGPLLATDLGATFRVAVTATNTAGSGVGTSAATDLVIGQQSFIKASNTETDDGFGISVAISGDTMVVGAPGEGSNATGVNGDEDNNDAVDSGAAYVFTRTAGVWSQQAYLKASNTEGGDNFGSQVAISGDTIVVAARWEDSDVTGTTNAGTDLSTNNDALNSGALYVFTRTADMWSQQAYLKASNTETRDYFGSSLAISGDTIVAGTPVEDSDVRGTGNAGTALSTNNDALESGAAYVFTRTAGAWSQQAYLKADNAETQDYFGHSVAISGDTIVVGALFEGSDATGVNGDGNNNDTLFSGAAYVFTRSAAAWSQQAYLKASNTEFDDDFGQSVAISGDTIVVGALAEDSAATGVNGDESSNSADGSGAAYVFTRSAGVWSQQAYLKASNTGTGDLFGQSVAMSGDTIVVGTWLEDSSAKGLNGDGANDTALSSGAAYVFTRSAGTWSQQAYLKASNTEANDRFGLGIAVSGKTVVAAAFGEDSDVTGTANDGTTANTNNDAPFSGAGYVYLVRVAPQNTVAPTITAPATPVVGDVLTAVAGTWSEGPVTFAYQWRRCVSGSCTNIVGATASTYVVTSSDAGATIRVTVSATNSVGSSTALSTATGTVSTGAATAPSNSAPPTISNTSPKVRDKLTATTGTWVGATSYAYQWLRCDNAGGGCQPISRATKNAYTVVSADVGSTLKVTVTATNAVGSTPNPSAATNVVTAL